uniref:Uncharacterized protein n=1 Tax=Accipiter nisus TaxID=211598 RepID=A0A8B9MZ59_9AVES
MGWRPPRHPAMGLGGTLWGWRSSEHLAMGLEGRYGAGDPLGTPLWGRRALTHFAMGLGGPLWVWRPPRHPAMGQAVGLPPRDGCGAGVPADTYVIKLFDRSVELGQFPEGTPLYPVCRAWMRNCPAARGGAAPQHPAAATPRPEVRPPGARGTPECGGDPQGTPKCGRDPQVRVGPPSAPQLRAGPPSVGGTPKCGTPKCVWDPQVPPKCV